MLKKITIGAILVSMYSYAYIFSREPFEFYVSYIIYIIYLPFFFTKFGIPKWPTMIFFPLFIAGIITTQIGLNTPQQFYKTIIGFFASCVFYHYVIQAFDYDVKSLFRFYMKSAYVISIIGLIQIASYMVGFKFGYDYHWIFNKWNTTAGGLGIRVNAVFSEPAYYAATMAPAFFVGIYNLLKREENFVSKFKSLIIVLAYFTPFSSVGIMGIFLTIIILLINLGFFRYAFIMIPLLVFVARYSYFNVPEFRDRWDGTIALYTTDNIYSYDIHGSSFVLYNNSHVAWENFKKNPIMGTGLGSHPIAFDKYSYTNVIGAVQLDYNSKDANSMFLRLMSETGLYGMVVILLLLFGSWVFSWQAVEKEYWLISNACALIILLYMLRQGHYFLNGFPFFLWLHFYTNKLNKYKMKEKKLAELEGLEAISVSPVGVLHPDQKVRKNEVQ